MLHITSDDYKSQSYALAAKIQAAQTQPYASIVAITKGGLHLAYYLADVLGIKDIRTYCCGSYTTENTQGELRVYYQPDLSVFQASPDYPEGQRILLVDDLIDSGKTLAYILDAYPHNALDIAVLYAKDHHTLTPAITQRTVNTGKDTHIHVYQDNLPGDTRIGFYYDKE